MCEFFGIASGDSRNNRNIKEAISKLEQDGLLRQIRDGQVYTLTLSRKAERQKKVIRIQKDWIEIAKRHRSSNTNVSVSWMNLLKVWLFLIDNKKEIITNCKIAETLNVSISTVKNAKHILLNELSAICSKRITKKSADGAYRCLGSTIDVKAWLDD